VPFTLGLISLIKLVFLLYYVVLFARVILSWVRLPTYHPLMRTVGPPLYALTEPLLAPIRRLLRPYMAGSPIDISPLVLYFGLILLQRVIISALSLSLLTH